MGDLQQKVGSQRRGRYTPEGRKGLKRRKEGGRKGFEWAKAMHLTNTRGEVECLRGERGERREFERMGHI